MNTQPDLGITNPYALDQDQFDAAVDVLKEQNEHIGEYWTDYPKESQAFKTGSSVLGTTWEYTAQHLRAEDPVRRCSPTRAPPAGPTPG